MRTIDIRGVPFHLHDNEAISNAMVRDNDFFEDHILDYFRATFTNTHSTIVDIGANMGNHTQYFARYFDYKQIISFEPIPDNFELLIANTVIYPNIKLYNMALSNFCGKIKMKRHWENWGAHFVTSEGEIDIECITLDSLNLQDVTLIKMDVEEHEPQVFEGAAETIERCKPIIILEDVYQKYSTLPQLQGYKQVAGWPVDFTYIYVWEGTNG